MRRSLPARLFVRCLAAGAMAFVAATVSLAQSVPSNSGDPLTGEVLRALQQRGAASPNAAPLQPSVQIQNPPVYPAQMPSAGGAAVPVLEGGLSPVERLMSQRSGQRVRQFGYDVFGRGGAVVVRQSGALQDNYILGAGDEIVVTLRGQQNATYTTRVDRDGRVVLPGLRPIGAAGRSFGAFRDDLEAEVGRAFTGTGAEVSVGAVRQISVRVVGEVAAPGVFSLTGLSSAMDALNLAGGVKKTGSLRDIQIVRAGRSIHLDLYALLTNRAAGSDITLTDGDRIVVPVVGGSVAVVGGVKRPAIYELPPRARTATMRELLGLAGGTEVSGAYRFSVLRTRADGRRELVRIAAGADAPVRDGDVVFVASTADISLAKVELMGSTRLNGYYPLDAAGSLRALLKSSDMFAPVVGKPLPYLLIGAVVRLDPETMQRTVLPFSPVDVIGGRADLALQSNDLVYVLDVPEMRYIAQRAAAAQEASTRRLIDEHPNNRAPMSSPDNPALANGPIGALQASPLNRPGGVSNPAANDIVRADQPFVVLPETPGGAEAAGPASSPVTPGMFADQGVAPAAEPRTAPPSATPQTEEEIANPGIVAPLDPSAYRIAGDVRGPSPDATPDVDRAAAPRLFVGLDDDARRLLVNTLSNYYVTVVGEVNNPGAFLAMPGTTLDKIVQAAGDVTPRVDLNAFEITSAEVDNASGTSRTIRRSYHLPAGAFAQVALRPYDRVRFNPVFSDRDSGEVEVFGEVRYPGGYEILRGEHLSSVLARAGGFTGAAYPAGAIFLRRWVAEQERGVMLRQADTLESDLVSLMGTVSSKAQISDAEIQYVNQLVLRLRSAGSPGGRVAVEIDPAVIAARPDLDVVLEPGDQLYVPRKPSSVIVAGEVMSPGGIQFQAGRSISDYVALAGGTTENANDDHIFVIQPDGSAVQADSGAFFASRTPVLAPGAVIVVPRTLRHFTWDAFLESAIQITSQLAITAASISVIHN